jgi:hypothetical protein
LVVDTDLHRLRRINTLCYFRCGLVVCVLYVVCCVLDVICWESGKVPILIVFFTTETLRTQRGCCKNYVSLVGGGMLVDWVTMIILNF